jgi:hypothetical protein
VNLGSAHFVTFETRWTLLAFASGLATFVGGQVYFSESASLTFSQHGERYFLAEISIPGTASVRSLVKSRAERVLIEQAKRDAAEPKTVTIAADMR